MKKLLLLLLLAVPALAQNVTSPPLATFGTITATATTCIPNVVATGCVNQPLNGATSYVGVSFLGTWSATILVRASADHGATWTQLDSVTSNKQAVYNVAGYTDIDVRCSAFSSGVASISFNPSTASNLNSPPSIGSTTPNSATFTALTASSLTVAGTAAVLTGTGACLTADITTQLGGTWAGSAKCTNTTGASTLIITPGFTAANGFACYASDITSANAVRQSASSATSCTISGIVTANDVLTFIAVAF